MILKIQDHIRKIGSVFTGLSKTLQNDLIEWIANYVSKNINYEIKDCMFFSVQADDTTDITEKSQCAISVRYVNKSGEVKERFVGFLMLVKVAPLTPYMKW